MLSVRFEDALVYACQVHAAQRRKGTEIPYISHLLAVAATVIEMGGDEDLAIAALLHDCAEDQGGRNRLKDISQRFGNRVASVVEGCSDSLVDTSSGEIKPDWRERKQAYLRHLYATSKDVQIVSLADKLHNARSILRDRLRSEIGEAIWDRFNQPREATLWYYGALAKCFFEVLPGVWAGELAYLVDDLSVIDS